MQKYFIAKSDSQSCSIVLLFTTGKLGNNRNFRNHFSEISKNIDVDFRC